MRIDRDSGEFPRDQLARQLRERIESGGLRKGQKLPTIVSLTEQTGLSVDTVRAAYKILADEGLVRIVPGLGTYVA